MGPYDKPNVSFTPLPGRAHPFKTCKNIKNMNGKNNIFDQWFWMTLNDAPWFSMTFNDLHYPWTHIPRSFLMVVPRSDFNFWGARRQSEWTQQQYNIQAFHKPRVETVGIKGRVVQIKSRADREDSSRPEKKSSEKAMRNYARFIDEKQKNTSICSHTCIAYASPKRT